MSAPDVQATPAIETDAEGLRDDERNGWKSAAQAVCRDHLRHGDVANGCARVPAGAMCARCFRPARCPVVVRRREG